VAFGCASAAVYLVNDVVDAERDRRHPVKRHRPIASGALPGAHAVALAVVAACCAVAVGAAIGEPLLIAAAAGYLCSSFLYSARLKHVPFVEMALVASGFLLRVSLAADAVRHRPVMRWYMPRVLRLAQVVIGALTLAMYLMWASGESAGTRAWHMASAVPLGLALGRFGVLTARRTFRQVEDMITGDGPMLACEIAWLSLFCAGLYAGG